MAVYEYPYEPELTVEDGEYVDSLIEDLLTLIYRDDYNAEGFDKLYTALVREYINPECPDLMAGHAGRDRINVGAINYLVMLQLDFTVITPKGIQWPTNGFSFLPKATTAVAIHYPNEDAQTGYTPGVSLNQASLAAIIQLVRELSHARHNEPELPLRPNYDA